MSEEKFFLEPSQLENVILTSPSPFTELYFQVEEIIIQCRKLQLKIPRFWNLDDVEEIIFKFPDSEHHYKKMKKNEVSE